ncbi:MAG TPA: hypothetical protein VF495_22675 [Phenylobacterium sp.]
MSKSKSESPGHYTAHGTRKFQANGPIEWSKAFKRVAGKDGREGEGIRAALAYAVAHEDAFAKWAESHIAAWSPAGTAPVVKPAKAPKAKPAKAPKAKPAKAPKAKPAKADAPAEAK